MAYKPPKGVSPPQLEGKRTGRPRGSRNHAKEFRDAVWGYDHMDEFDVPAPTPAAGLWRDFASLYPNEVSDWLWARDQI